MSVSDEHPVLISLSADSCTEAMPPRGYGENGHPAMARRDSGSSLSRNVVAVVGATSDGGWAVSLRLWTGLSGAHNCSANVELGAARDP
jgi:hypothetical protein